MKRRLSAGLAATAVAVLLAIPLTAATGAVADDTVVPEQNSTETTAPETPEAAPSASAEVPAPAPVAEPAAVPEPTTVAPAPAPAPVSDAPAVLAEDEEPVEDTTAPIFEARTPAGGGVYVGDGSLFIDFNCSDLESGIAECSLLDDQWQSQALGAPLSLAAGSYTWTGVAVNSSGLRTEQAVTFTVIAVDTTAPTVVSDAVPTSSGWSTNDAIAFVANDPGGSGVNTIFVKRDAGEVEKFSGANVSYPLLPGAQMFEFWASDNAGNVSAPQVVNVNADFDMPVIEVEPFGVTWPYDAQIVLERGSEVRLNYTCSDSTSGIASCHSAIKSGDLIPTDTVSAHTLQITATDTAGNTTRRLLRYIVTVDDTAPTVTSDFDPAPGEEWTTDGDIAFSATDSLVGVEAIHVRRNGVTTSTPGDAATYRLTPGEQVLEYWATDKFGNESEHKTITPRFDNDMPLIHVDPFGTKDVNGRTLVEQGSAIHVGWECTDATSGIETCLETTGGSAPLATSHLGDTYFVVTATDFAGNTEAAVVEYTVVPADASEPPTTPTDPEGPTTPSTPGEPSTPGQPTTPQGPSAPSGGAVADRDPGARDGSGAAQLAQTGLDTGWLPMLGLSVLVLGAVATLAERRSRRA